MTMGDVRRVPACRSFHVWKGQPSRIMVLEGVVQTGVIGPWQTGDGNSYVAPVADDDDHFGAGESVLECANVTAGASLSDQRRARLFSLMKVTEYREKTCFAPMKESPMIERMYL